MSPWRVVLAKELRETIRDRRTMVMMIVVPVLLYPVLLIVSEQLLLFGRRTLESQVAPVTVVGEAPPDLMEIIRTRGTLSLVTPEGDPIEALRSGEVAAVASVGEVVDPDGTREVKLLYDATSDHSTRGRTELGRALDAWRDSLLTGRLQARGLPGSFARPVEVADTSIASAGEVGGYALGRILPLLLVVITLLGAFYPAIDLAAGEKERGTLETLMTVPVPPRAILVGKFVTVAVIGVVAAGLNLTSMLLTFQTGMLQITEVIGIEVSLPLRSIAVVFLTLVPLAVLFGSLFLGLAVRSSSFKEAQNALTPVYMLVLIPAMLPIFPGIEFGPLMAITPVAGVSFFFRDVLTGDAAWGMGLLVLFSTTIYALAALAFAADSFGNERVLFGGGDATVRRPEGGWRRALFVGRRPGATPTAEASFLFVALAAVLFFYVGIRLQLELGEAGLLASEWLLLFLPAVLFVALRGFDPVPTLSLRAPSARGLGGGLLLIAGALPLVWFIGWLQTFVLPIPWEVLEGLEQLMTAEGPMRFLWLLLVLAVTPAFCEEVVFRGVLLAGTRRLPTWRVVVLNGLIFGAFHLSETVIRFLPTATLGAVIAWAVLRTRSIWVGSAMHFANNATLVALTSVPALRSLFSDPEAPPPFWLLPLGVAAFGMGVRVLRAEAPA